MYRPIPRMWDLVPGLYFRATKSSFTINFGKNQIFQTEHPTIVGLGRRSCEVRDSFYTALHRARLRRALLRRNRKHLLGKTITITPKTWWILLVLIFFFCPLTFAGIAMLSWLLATWLVLYVSYEAAHVVTKVTGRLLEGPVQTFISVIWNVARSVQFLLVTSGPTGKRIPPYIQLNIRPPIPQGGLKSPQRYERPISPWCEKSNPSWSDSSSELGLLLPEIVGKMFIPHRKLPRAASLGPLPKERKRRPKAVVNRVGVEVY